MSDDSFIKELQKNNIVISKYTKGPLGSRIFALGINGHTKHPEGIIKVWPAKTEIEINPVKKLRQTILNVHEDKRTVARDIGPFNISQHRNTYQQLIGTFRGRVTLPNINGLKFYTENVLSNNIKGTKVKTISGTVIVELPKTDQSFLIGMDETHNFISMLPKKASSVEEAHEILRPKVSDKAIRQGEFFFDPVVSHKILERLDEKMSNMRWYRNGWRILMTNLESRSSHIGVLTQRINGQLYAFGMVLDTRKGRHAPLLLNTWHKVVRNREVVIRNAVRTRTRTWD